MPKVPKSKLYGSKRAAVLTKSPPALGLGLPEPSGSAALSCQRGRAAPWGYGERWEHPSACWGAGCLRPKKGLNSSWGQPMWHTVVVPVAGPRAASINHPFCSFWGFLLPPGAVAPP